MLAASMSAMSACALQAQPNYTVELPVEPENNNTMAYLYDWDNNVKLDSVIVTDGLVKFSGHTDAPFIARLIINGARGPIFIVEDGDVVLGQEDGARTSLNAKMGSYSARMKAIVDEFKSIDRNDSTQMARAEALQKEYQDVPRKAYEENKGNILGLYYFLRLAYDMNLAEIDAAIAADRMLGESKRVQAIRTNLLAKAETSVGKHYKDFTVTYDGKEEKFSSYIKPGRYTLVDFWASWCGPCIRQTKYIKELYAKYKDKGLDVLGVAVWDEPANTLKAIKSHGLEWPCIINAQTVPTDLYGISGIPCILLINPEGIIVSRDKMGDELVEAVDSAMADYQPQAMALPADSAAADTASVSVIF